jgi:hypothetical protein
MKTLAVALIVSTVGLAFVLASPAEAAQSSKHKKYKTAKVHKVHQVKQRHSAVAAGPHYQGGVLAGPLYNGQDYLGDDPDPNIRAFIIRDMTRYRGSY